MPIARSNGSDRQPPSRDAEPPDTGLEPRLARRVAEDTWKTSRQIEQIVAPVEPQRDVVEEQQSTVGSGENGRHKQAGTERDEADSPGFRRPRVVPDPSRRDAEQQREGCEQPHRCTGAAPPDLEHADPDHVGHHHDQQLRAPTAQPGGSRDHRGENEAVDGRVGDESKLLIENQSRTASREVGDGRLRIGAVGRRGVEGAVKDVEIAEPRGGAGGGEHREHQELPHVSHAGAHAQCGGGGDEREAGLQPGQDRERDAREQPHRFPFRLLSEACRDQRKRSEQHTGRGDPVREYLRRLKHKGRRQGAAGPSEPRRAGTARRSVTEVPDKRRTQSGDQAKERDRSGIAEKKQSRCDEDGQTRRVNGVDGAVNSPAQVVRPLGVQRKLEVVALLVVVLDSQIAVTDQASRENQIVGRVAVRQDRRNPPRARAVDRQRQRRRGNRRASPVREPSAAHRWAAGDDAYDHDDPDACGEGSRPEERRGRQWHRKPRQDDDRGAEEGPKLRLGQPRRANTGERAEHERCEEPPRWEQGDPRVRRSAGETERSKRAPRREADTRGRTQSLHHQSWRRMLPHGSEGEGRNTRRSRRAGIPSFSSGQLE